jgi:hypothetical protein
MKKDSSATNCITAGATIKQRDGTNCGSVDISGNGADVATLLPDAISDVATFVAAANLQTASNPITAPIKIAKNGMQEIDDNVAGLNVVTVPSITLGVDGTLSVGGGATDQIVVMIAVDLKVRAGAILSPVSPLTSAQHVIVVLGKSVSLGANSHVSATVVAPGATCTVGADSDIIGALICGEKATLGADAKMPVVPSVVTLP